jgi:hypothetical protein
MHWLVETYEPAVRQAIEPEAAAVPDQAIEHVIEPVIDDAPVLRAERRAERRVDCAFAVAAAAPSDPAETALGEAVDISLSGIHVVMDKVAMVGPIDLIVSEVVVEARVVGYQKLDDGRHSWHVHVLDADDAWSALALS